MKSKLRLTHWFVVCLTLAPPCFLALLICKYSVDLPQWDEWEYVYLFEKLSRGSLTIANLFAQMNEYRQFFPNLVIVALGWLTRGDVRYEMLATFVVACLISFGVYRLAERTIGGDRILRLFLFLIANLIIFSPSQYENWLQGQQLVYYFPIACIIICLLVAYSDWNLKTKFAVCACLSVVSTFSSANGILCWLVVLPVLVPADPSNHLSVKRRLVTAWIFGLFASAALYLYHYQKPLSSPSPATALFHPVLAVTYFLGFLGAPVALEKGKVAAVAGLILTSAFALSSFYLFKRRAELGLVRRMIGWLMIGAYSILTGVMTTIGRLGFGVGQSQNTRYIGFSAYLLVAVVFLVVIISQDCSIKTNPSSRAIQVRRFAFLFVALILLLQPFIFVLSINRMAEKRTTLLQAKAMLLFINLTPDPALVVTLYPDLNSLREHANSLNQLGFLRPQLIKTLKVQEFAGTGSANPVEYGSWDQLTSSNQNRYLASGWATLPGRGEMADAILFAYQTSDREISMFKMTLPAVPSRREWLSRSRPAKWQASFAADEFPSAPGTLTAWGFDAKTGKAFRLNGSFRIPEADHSAQNYVRSN